MTIVLDYLEMVSGLKCNHYPMHIGICKLVATIVNARI
jgi:hypothetical protein